VESTRRTEEPDAPREDYSQARMALARRGTSPAREPEVPGEGEHPRTSKPGTPRRSSEEYGTLECSGDRSDSHERRARVGIDRRRGGAWEFSLGEAGIDKIAPAVFDDEGETVSSEGENMTSRSPTNLSLRGEEDKAMREAKERNRRRIEEANTRDKELISKYLPSDIAAFFPVRMIGPDDKFEPPKEWIRDIREVVESECPTPSKSEFRFETSEEAVQHNGALFERAGFDFEGLMEDQRGTTVWHGSEFRPVHHLEK